MSRPSEPASAAPALPVLSGVPEPCCTLDIDGPEQERLIDMFRGLANPVRFEILKFLITRPGCITGDIVEYIPRSQATVSQHLKVLRETGWVTGTVEGPATCYCLADDNVRWFRARVDDVF